MDLNSQMILMRKDIKRAKVHVVSKLVRQIRNLRNKKGTEQQMKKNNNRADKLVEEIQILKDTKPDSIFKFIVVTESTLEELSRDVNASLQDRACIRVSLLPFIMQKLKPIREQIKEFDAVRSEKNEITSVKVSKRLLNPPKPEHSGVAGKPETPRSKMAEVETRKVDDNPSTQPSHQGERLSPCDVDDVLSAQDNCGVDDVISAEDNCGVDDVISAEDNGGVDTSKLRVLDDDATRFDDEDDEDGGSRAMSDASDGNDYQVVMPKFYTRPSIQQPPTKRLVEMSKAANTDDVTDLLENLGQGYCDSDDESDDDKSDDDKSDDDKSDDDGGDDDDDDEGDDDVNDADDGSSGETYNSDDDQFFIDDSFTVAGGVAKKPTPPTKPTSARISSTFLSLSSRRTQSKKKESAQKAATKAGRKKKNRLGQRARQQLYGGKKSSVDHKLQGAANRQRRHPAANQAAPPRPAEVALHPSWQASQVRKRQCAIQRFEGKRVKFDDSE